LLTLFINRFLGSLGFLTLSASTVILISLHTVLLWLTYKTWHICWLKETYYRTTERGFLRQ